MTTGTKIVVGVAAAGAGFVVWRFWGARWWSQHRGTLGFGGARVPPMPPPGSDPLTNPAIATLPILPELVIPPPRPIGQTEDFPPGFGVVASAGQAMRGAPPPPPPPPPPPIEVSTSVGNLWVPPTISQQQALDKVADLKAIYASTERPEEY